MVKVLILKAINEKKLQSKKKNERMIEIYFFHLLFIF